MLRRVTWSASGQQSQGSPERSHPPPLSEHTRALLSHAAIGHHRVSPLVSSPSPSFGGHSHSHSSGARAHAAHAHAHAVQSQPYSDQHHSLFGSVSGASAIFTPALSRSRLAARLAVDPVSVAPPELPAFSAFGSLEARSALGVVHSGSDSHSASASPSGSASRSPSQSEAGSPPSVCHAALASPSRTSPVTPREVVFANLNLALPSTTSAGGSGALGGDRSQTERQVSYMSRRSTDFSVRSTDFPVRTRA